MNARAFAVRTIAIAFGALAFTAAPARAQGASLAADAAPAQAQQAVSTPAPSGPSLESATVAVHSTNEALSAPKPAGRNVDQGTKLMIVGGAAILTGIVIGGDAGHAISIAGAVVGLIGLYQYLQ